MTEIDPNQSGSSSFVPKNSEYPLGRRINVKGKGGKTTLSKAIAARFGLEFIEHDEIRHQANWEERSRDEHIKVFNERIGRSPNGWVADGNYGSIGGLGFDDVDTVIALALPLRVMMWRTFKRTVRRWVRREELWNGNRESFWTSFFNFSSQSVIYDIWVRRDRFRSIAELAQAETPEHVNLVIIRSSKELDDFYERYGLVRQ
jgi:adenylate kinase family enzyme